jgi:prevent-host-death family protein
MSNKQTPSFKDMGIEHVSVREARENFAPLLMGVATASERVVLTRHGKPWVVIVDVDDLSELVKLDDQKLTAFALEHHGSVNDVTKDHVSTQEEVTNILDTEDIDSFTDTAPEKEKALEGQVGALKRAIEKLRNEKAHLEGMVEVFQNTMSQHSAVTLPNGRVAHVGHVVKVEYTSGNSKRWRAHSSGTFGSRGRAVGTGSNPRNAKVSGE